ncbi:DUF6475 domain-containing protein [Paraburkholderia sp. BL17N1]|uniref:DUF6475 domain-containing protein n=1 Tax=Paraburkholderia sp. BL17N1 TaxID=1938798 RepID=UPI000F0D5BE4|nr:DUF6475 domain-containing protein [Paraburkholderia sp. BL17N1]RKR46286.1 hypothetical protein B0G82_3968 [Paraburkholderia sp. BL17N1]
MITTDKAKFFDLMADVLAFYGKDFSDFAGRVWWEALRAYDLPAVQDAFNRHCVNPDSGQFAPKPADVVKMLSGSTQDAALVAWSKVDRAVREVGTYRSVVFDDPVIHRVVTDMGGWVLIGGKDDEAWPFVRNEFVNRYRGFRMRSETPEYLPVLIGIAEASNNEARLNSQPPVLIGEARAAYAVMTGGGNKPLIEITQIRQQPALLSNARGAA